MMWMTASILGSLAAGALAGCGPSIARLNELAATGRVRPGAPVVAHVQIEITAPPARVWALLVDAPSWPRWDADISKVSITQPLAPGTQFTWGEGSNQVHSQVQLFEPEKRLAWTGTAFTVEGDPRVGAKSRGRRPHSGHRQRIDGRAAHGGALLFAEA